MLASAEMIEPAARKPGQCDSDCLYLDPDADPEARIDDLLARMTVSEKVACLSTRPDVPRLGIRGTGHVEGLHGLTLGGPGQWGRAQPVPTTCFPQAIGLARTWDPELLRKVAQTEAYETRYVVQSPRYHRGGLVVRAPNADLGRDPRWGRTEECYGEDPFFNGTMAVAFVRGLQGDHPKYFCVAALLKHFLANSNEDEREHSSSDFDDRLFHEYYAVPFRMAIVEGGARAFMAAYNKYNGIPCSVHPVLKTIAADRWGQDGIICTDGGAYRLLVTAHHHFPDLAQAAAATVRAGISQFLDQFQEGVESALEQGLLTEADLDAAIRKNFRVMIRLGLLDPPERVPYASIGSNDEIEPWTRTQTHELVRQVTQKSAVLLKNEGNLLPLCPERIQSLALVGPLADRVLGDWYGGTLPYAVTPLSGIRERLAPGARLVAVSNNDVSEAMLAARECEIALVCVGNHPTGDREWAKVARPSYGKEAVDRQSLLLEDEGLVRLVRAANPRTVLVLISSFPYAIDWSNDNVPAILLLSHSSQELGHALSDVLFGDVNPAGRLVQTWPRADTALLPLGDYDLRKGRTYLYDQNEPLFCFGHGLSYTRFEYLTLRSSATVLAHDGQVRLMVTLRNVGDREGEEVVQLYVRHLGSRVTRPLLELRGFRRVAMSRGETAEVTFELSAPALSYYDPERAHFCVESGLVELSVGSSSRKLELSTVIEVKGDPES